MVSIGNFSIPNKLKANFNTGKIQIKKVDVGTAEPIEGVNFELLDLDGNVIQTATTDENGEIIFQNLFAGKYQLRETKTNENYEINPEIVEIETKYNQTTTITLESERKKGDLQVDKVDEIEEESSEISKKEPSTSKKEEAKEEIKENQEKGGNKKVKKLPKTGF